MQVDPAAAAARRDTPAGPVYFCSARCAAAFDSEPHQYAATTAAAVPGEGTR
jgi:Cu+-exporting ATPase